MKPLNFHLVRKGDNCKIDYDDKERLKNVIQKQQQQQQRRHSGNSVISKNFNFNFNFNIKQSKCLTDAIEERNSLGLWC